jgi:hypothetical protein
MAVAATLDTFTRLAVGGRPGAVSIRRARVARRIASRASVRDGDSWSTTRRVAACARFTPRRIATCARFAAASDHVVAGQGIVVCAGAPAASIDAEPAQVGAGGILAAAGADHRGRCKQCHCK